MGCVEGFGDGIMEIGYSHEMPFLWQINIRHYTLGLESHFLILC